VGKEIRRIETVYLQTTEQDWNRFHTTKLDPRYLHLLSQLKVGVLWGLIGDDNLWKKHPDSLASLCSELFALFEQIELKA
jgi:hypothetical protein